MLLQGVKPPARPPARKLPTESFQCFVCQGLRLCPGSPPAPTTAAHNDGSALCAYSLTLSLWPFAVSVYSEQRVRA